FLRNLKERAEIMLRPGSNALRASVAYIDQAMESLETEDYRKEMNQLRAAAIGGDKDAQSMLAAAVRRTTGALIMPNATWGAFFESVDLSAEDVFILESSIPN